MNVDTILLNIFNTGYSVLFPKASVFVNGGRSCSRVCKNHHVAHKSGAEMLQCHSASLHSRLRFPPLQSHQPSHFYSCVICVDTVFFKV